MPLNTRPIRTTDGLMPEDMLLNEKLPTPSGKELAGSLWRTSWSGGLVDFIGDKIKEEPYEREASPDYHYDLRKLDKKYYPIAEDVMEAQSEGEVNGLMADHDRFTQDQQTIAAAGVEGIMYGGLSAILDPVTLPLWFLPFGKGFQAAGTLGKMGRLTGLSMAEMTAGEAIMHHIDRSRDPNETSKNLFITAAVSSSLGALIGRMGQQLPPELRDQMVKDFAAEAGKQYDKGVRMYHGTHPEAIYDVVDLKYVGTGEGKQFQGWGLYMASKKGIAQWYAETVTSAFRAALKRTTASSDEIDAQVNFFADLITKRTGNIYTMEVRESAINNMLDWNIPLSQHSKAVKKALKDHKYFGLKMPKDATGHTLYRALTRKIQAEQGATFGEAQKMASLQLKDAGIKGNKYLDKPSRKATTKEKTQNVVAFDAGDIRVLRRNKTKINDPLHVPLEMTVPEAMAEVSAALTNRAEGSTVGAMGVPEQFADPQMEAPQKAFANIQKMFVRNPILRTAYSTDHGLAEPAKHLPELTLSGVEKNKHLLNVADDHPPLDWVIDRERRSVGNTLHAMKQAKRDILANHGDELTRNEISQMISQAAPYPDNHPLYAHHIKYPELAPLVNEVRRYRGTYEARMKAPRVGMMDEKVMTRFNAFYGGRHYDTQAIRNNVDEWVEAVRAGYRHMGDTRTDDELRERAMEAFYNSSTGSKLHGQGSFSGVKAPMQTTQGALKQITLEIPDEFIEKFLIRDIINDHDSMIRSLLPEIILRERYSDVERTVFGLRVNHIEDRYKKEFREKHKAILSAAKKRATKLEAAGDNEAAAKTTAKAYKKAEKLRKAHETNIKDLQHIIQKITGVGEESVVLTGPVAEFLSEVRGYAGGAHLGNSALASLHEPLTGMMVTGFTPLARSARVLMKGTPATKAEIEKLRSWGAGMDMRSHVTTAKARAEIDDPTVTRGWKSWGRRKVAPFTMRWNGQDLFNTTAKTGFAQTMQDMIIRHALGKHASKVGSPEYMTEISTMSKLGVDEAVMRGIKRNIDAGHYKEIDDVYFANVEDWDDAFLSDRFTEAAAQFADLVIVSNSSGALPRIMDNQLGRMFSMYRNIFFNMQTKTILPIAQRLSRGDMRTARLLMAEFGLAWSIYQLRLMGRSNWDMDKYEKEWNKMAIQDHLYEAFRASGLLGLTSEMLGAADNLSNGNASKLLHLNESTQNYFNRNLGLTGLSPAISWADKVARGTVGAAVSGGWTQSDINGLGYSLPGRSIPYLDPAISAIQDSIVEQFPQSRTQQRARRTRTANEVNF